MHFRIVLILALLLPLRLFGSASPVGLWRTIDAKSGETESTIRIERDGDSIAGSIETISDPEQARALCKSCKGELKDKPILGMRIMWGFEDKGLKWSNGEILDPNSGKLYHASIELHEDGQSLKLRGYIGFPVFGRSQVWERVE